MVITVEELACLDCLIWLRTGGSVAQRLGLSQPTISRRVQRVADVFGLCLVKPNGEWELRGDPTILNLERLVHQKYRWANDLPLRLEAQYWSGPLFCDFLPKGWLTGNFDFLEVRTPLRHLRSGVIDAWIGCFPDVPEDCDRDFFCVHLTRLPLRLVVSATHPLAVLGDRATLEDVKRYPSLALPDHAFPKLQAVLQELGLWNLPIPLKRYSYEKWEGQVMENGMVGYATSLTIHLFDAPQVFLPIQIPVEVGETVVVRRDYANHPRFVNLVGHLKVRAVQLQQRCSDVSLCF